MALLLVIATALGLGVFASRGGRIGQPAFMRPIERSLRSLFAQRSPGQRTVAELLKRRQLIAGERAHAQVLGPAEATDEPVEWNPADQIVDLDGPLEMAAPPLDDALALVPPANGPPANCCPGAPDGGIVVPGPGEPPAPGVPEPSTWLTMLIGFAMAGLALRRQRRLGHRAVYN